MELHFERFENSLLLQLLQRIVLYCTGPSRNSVVGVFDALVSRICSRLLAMDPSHESSGARPDSKTKPSTHHSTGILVVNTLSQDSIVWLLKLADLLIKVSGARQ